MTTTNPFANTTVTYVHSGRHKPNHVIQGMQDIGFAKGHLIGYRKGWVVGVIFSMVVVAVLSVW